METFTFKNAPHFSQAKMLKSDLYHVKENQSTAIAISKERLSKEK